MDIWCFFFKRTFEFNFLKSKRPNLKKNLIRQYILLLLKINFCCFIRLQMKLKKLNYYCMLY